MTAKDASGILALLKTAYPNQYKNLSRDEAGAMIRLWAAQLSDVPAGLALEAVQWHISHSAWPPTIAEVNQRLDEMMQQAFEILPRPGRVVFGPQPPDDEIDRARRTYNALAPRCTDKLEGDNYKRRALLGGIDKYGK